MVKPATTGLPKLCQGGYFCAWQVTDTHRQDHVCIKAKQCRRPKGFWGVKKENMQQQQVMEQIPWRILSLLFRKIREHILISCCLISFLFCGLSSVKITEQLSNCWCSSLACVSNAFNKLHLNVTISISIVSKHDTPPYSQPEQQRHGKAFSLAPG